VACNWSKEKQNSITLRCINYTKIQKQLYIFSDVCRNVTMEDSAHIFELLFHDSAETQLENYKADLEDLFKEKRERETHKRDVSHISKNNYVSLKHTESG
jgi:hypothetical protein